MVRPADMDTDTNLGKITWEVALRVVPDTPFAAAVAATITARIKARTGVTPTGVTVDAAGAATLTIPDDGTPVAVWVGWVASVMAAMGRPGVVTAVGNQARVTA